MAPKWEKQNDDKALTTKIHPKQPLGQGSGWQYTGRNPAARPGESGQACDRLINGIISTTSGKKASLVYVEPFALLRFSGTNKVDPENRTVV
jgi:hypothetical protein